MPPQYRAYLDECGSHEWRRRLNGMNRYLCIVGVFVRLEDYEEMRRDMERIKGDYFGSDSDNPVILHRSDIVGRRGCFRVLRSESLRRNFNTDIVRFFRSHRYTVVGVVIDKRQHRERYGTRSMHPYHYGAEAMLERFCMFLNRRRAQGEFYAEARGRREDGLLSERWRTFRRDGTRFISHKDIRQAIPTENIRFRTKPQNVCGIQLADMLSSTVAQDVLIEYGQRRTFRNAFERHVAASIAERYDRNTTSGRTRGYGKVLLSGP